jgi:hypothetical protein
MFSVNFVLLNQNVNVLRLIPRPVQIRLASTPLDLYVYLLYMYLQSNRGPVAPTATLNRKKWALARATPHCPALTLCLAPLSCLPPCPVPPRYLPASPPAAALLPPCLRLQVKAKLVTVALQVGSSFPACSVVSNVLKTFICQLKSKEAALPADFL